MRLDVYLTEHCGVVSRNKAKQLIEMKRVTVDSETVTKPSFEVKDGDNVEITSAMEFVSMGGYKLERALNEFDIRLEGKVCADIGASNGGFTCCILRHGAAKVYAVDVGDCALENELLRDDRVIVKDNLNARYIVKDDLGEYVDFISVDVSFISLKLMLGNVLKLMKESGEAVVLVKPQFEAGRANLTKRGIVTDRKIRFNILIDIAEYIASLGYKVTDAVAAPIRHDKNIEFLLRITRSGKGICAEKLNKVAFVVE